MDEIYGYLPPVANPPSKGPLLLLLKQARAFGLGLLVATQNPADLDYKALANCGTWFIGRLQTDRDKQRVLEGLESASAGRGADRTKLNALLNALGKRVFLLNSVHEAEAKLFTTRWTMSYLRGPLTREQIRVLMDNTGRPAAPPPPLPPASAAGSPAPSPEPPAVEPGVWQLVLPEAGPLLHPTLGLRIRATFASRRPAVETPAEVLVSVPFGPDGQPAWQQAGVACATHQAHPPVAHGGPVFVDPPPAARQTAQQQAWQIEGRGQLGESLEISVLREGKITGAPFETDAEFRLRLEQAAREERDEAVRLMRQKFETKLRSAADKVIRAREAVAGQKTQARSAQVQTAISVGTSLLGALFGKRASGLGHIWSYHPRRHRRPRGGSRHEGVRRGRHGRRKTRRRRGRRGGTRGRTGNKSRRDPFALGLGFLASDPAPQTPSLHPTHRVDRHTLEFMIHRGVAKPGQGAAFYALP